MKKIIPATTRDSRCGTVQLELTIFLPLFALMLVLQMTIASYGRVGIKTAVNAQRDAWQDKSKAMRKRLKLPADITKDFDVIGDILNKQQASTHGLVQGTATSQVSSKLPRFGFATTTADNYILQDPWDFRTLSFDSKQEHRQLTLDRRAVAIAKSRSLMSLGDLLSATSIGTTLLQVTASISDFYSQVARAMENINQQIANVEKSISDLRNRLRKLQSQKPVDKEAVRRLQATLNEELKKRARLQQDKSRIRADAREAESYLKIGVSSLPDADDEEDDL